MAGFSLKLDEWILFGRNLNAESGEVTSAEEWSGQISKSRLHRIMSLPFSAKLLSFLSANFV
jgi:hypothetical protein